MGLDMYLEKRTYVSEKERETLKVQGSAKIKTSRVSAIIEEVGYWRKANHIHKWFVDNVQDGNDNCQNHYVSEAQLKTLLSLVKKVLSDRRLAEKLLPVQEGFFFGGDEYDEWYFEDLELTKQIMAAIILAKECETGSIYYRSSW